MVNVDRSRNLIESMQRHYKSNPPKLTYIQADARKLKSMYNEGEFDIVIDKGCYDAICCSEESVDNRELYL